MTSAERQRGYRDAINAGNALANGETDLYASARAFLDCVIAIQALLSAETETEGDKSDTATTEVPALPE